MKLKIEYVFVIVVLLCLTLPSIFINTKKICKMLAKVGIYDIIIYKKCGERYE